MSASLGIVVLGNEKLLENFFFLCKSMYFCSSHLATIITLQKCFQRTIVQFYKEAKNNTALLIQ
jgi:hypothetical protein